MSAAGGGLAAGRVQVRAGGSVLVDGVDLQVQPGSLTALVGPNGAGKSTLLRVLAGIDRPDAGEVRFRGDDLFAIRRRARAKLASLVEQDAVTDLPLTVRSTVALGRLPHESMLGGADAEDSGIVDRSLALVGMTSFAERELPTLSGGERQRVLLAKALAQQTPLLLLDEPTNHLDIGAQLSVLGLLERVASTGSTVLAALHDLTLAAAFCRSVIVMADGRVVAAGPTRETLTPELLHDVYGVRAVLLESPVDGRPVISFSPSIPEA
jgi:iron complex transport system ATP-binding protein